MREKKDFVCKCANHPSFSPFKPRTKTVLGCQTSDSPPFPILMDGSSACWQIISKNLSSFRCNVNQSIFKLKVKLLRKRLKNLLNKLFGANTHPTFPLSSLNVWRYSVNIYIHRQKYWIAKKKEKKKEKVPLCTLIWNWFDLISRDVCMHFRHPLLSCRYRCAAHNGQVTSLLWAKLPPDSWCQIHQSNIKSQYITK